MTAARRPHDARARTAALDQVRQHGIAEASRRTGVARSTLRRWRAAAPDQPPPDQPAEDPAVARARVLDDARDRSRTLLAAVSVQSLEATLAALAGGKRPDGTVHPALTVTKPSDLVSMWKSSTSAIELLDGRATERADSRVSVVFTAPRPARRVPGAAVDEQHRP